MAPPCPPYDVAIIGGGPGGSTCASVLKKYNPALKVVILEKERFPREHIGESQLPLIGHILDEIGAWEKIEAAQFPLKLGATYRWGQSPKLWDFGFMNYLEFKEQPRPGTFTGQRRRLAFQVERATYDTILLDHAAGLGCEVRQGTQVTEVRTQGDRVTGLQTDRGPVEARHYVDASGTVGLIRRALDVPIEYPTALRNIALWDYWEDAQWGVRVGPQGGGATRILVLSITCGWLWFIPISATRTSIGFVVPAEYYKSSGKTPEDLYAWAVAQEPLVSELTGTATRTGKVRATRDWSSITERAAGENWLLVGDAAGFGDPILSAGMMLAHASAREAAYTILELDRGAADGAWLKSFYDQQARKRVLQHIRFAEFWYSQNGQFTDLEDFTSRLAAESGISLSPKDAFWWLSNGGFTNDVLGRAGLGGVDFSMVMLLAQELSGDRDLTWQISRYNVFEADLRGAEERPIPIYYQGQVRRERCLVRADRTLPLVGIYALMLGILRRHSTIDEIRAAVVQRLTRGGKPPAERDIILAMQGLEVMLLDRWVVGRYDPARPRYRIIRGEARASDVPDAGSGVPRTRRA